MLQQPFLYPSAPLWLSKFHLMIPPKLALQSDAIPPTVSAIPPKSPSEDADALSASAELFSESIESQPPELPTQQTSPPLPESMSDSALAAVEEINEVEFNDDDSTPFLELMPLDNALKTKPPLKCLGKRSPTAVAGAAVSPSCWTTKSTPTPTGKPLPSVQGNAST